MRPQEGFTAHVHHLGQGPRRALALHCTMAFGGAWGGLAREMGERVTFVAPDLPNHGKSPDWDGVADVGDTAFASARAVMDAEPMDVIGHSFGAITALRLALDAPERVRSLTLIEPVFFAVARADAPQVVAQDGNRADAFQEAIAAGDYVAAARAFNRMWSDDGPSWDSLPERTRAAMARGVRLVPDTYPYLYDDARGLLPQVSGLDVPCLLVRGEKAHPAITAINDGLATRLPDARQAVIAGAGHMAPITHPGAMAQAWGALLDRTAPAEGAAV